MNRILRDKEFKNLINDAKNDEERDIIIKAEGFEFTEEEIWSLTTHYQEHARDICRRIVLQRYGKLKFNDNNDGWGWEIVRRQSSKALTKI